MEGFRPTRVFLDEDEGGGGEVAFRILEVFIFCFGLFIVLISYTYSTTSMSISYDQVFALIDPDHEYDDILEQNNPENIPIPIMLLSIFFSIMLGFVLLVATRDFNIILTLVFFIMGSLFVYPFTILQDVANSLLSPIQFQSLITKHSFIYSFFLSETFIQVWLFMVFFATITLILKNRGGDKVI